MIGVIVVGHEGMAHELLNVAQGAMPAPQGQVAAVCVPKTDSLRLATERVAAAAAQVDDGAGVIVLADLLGATPANAACEGLYGRPGAVITGANAAMVLAVLEGRRRNRRDVADLVECACCAGRKHIVTLKTRL